MLFPKRVIILLFPPIPLPAPLFVVLYAAFELYAGVTGSMSGVAHFAHLGGLVGGLVLMRIRSEEHTSELQSLMRISYAVFCLKKKHTQCDQILKAQYSNA